MKTFLLHWGLVFSPVLVQVAVGAYILWHHHRNAQHRRGMIDAGLKNVTDHLVAVIMEHEEERSVRIARLEAAVFGSRFSQPGQPPPPEWMN